MFKRLIALFLALCVTSVFGEDEDERVHELLDLQRRSKGSVIRFDAGRWEKFASGKSRPYSLVLFVNSNSVQSSQLANLLQEMRIEFGYTASSYAKQLPTMGREGKVFFVELEHSEATTSIFYRMGISSLPYAIHYSGSVPYRADAKIKIEKEDRMTPKSHTLPWNAHSFATFVGERTGVVVEVVTPSIFRTWWWPFIAVGILGGLVYSLVTITASRVFKNNLEMIGIVGSILVYWFATSGGLYNIIRNMPFSYPDQRSGKMVYAIQGSGQQLGAEGFLVGTLYMLFAIPLALMTFIVPKIKNQARRDTFSSGLIILMVVAMYGVYYNYKWKTGYHLNNYLFPSGSFGIDYDE